MAKLDINTPFDRRPFSPHPASTLNAARDHAHAEAYRDLEDAICRLRSASSLMNLVVEGTIDASECPLAAQIRATAKLSGHRLLVLTEEQRDALSYSISQVHGLIDTLRNGYYAAWDAGRDA